MRQSCIETRKGLSLVNKSKETYNQTPEFDKYDYYKLTKYDADSRLSNSDKKKFVKTRDLIHKASVYSKKFASGHTLTKSIDYTPNKNEKEYRATRMFISDTNSLLPSNLYNSSKKQSYSTIQRQYGPKAITTMSTEYADIQDFSKMANITTYIPHSNSNFGKLIFDINLVKSDCES